MGQKLQNVYAMNHANEHVISSTPFLAGTIQEPRFKQLTGNIKNSVFLLIVSEVLYEANNVFSCKAQRYCAENNQQTHYTSSHPFLLIWLPLKNITSHTLCWQ